MEAAGAVIFRNYVLYVNMRKHSRLNTFSNMAVKIFLEQINFCPSTKNNRSLEKVTVIYVSLYVIANLS